MPRFALLRHDHPALHWDLMLEAGNALWTWRLPRPLEDGDDQSAERIGDHRLIYLDYEGPVSGGRGMVACEDRGDYRGVEQADGRLVVELHGGRLRGRLELTRQRGADWRAQFFATDGRGGAAAARGSIDRP